MFSCFQELTRERRILEMGFKFFLFAHVVCGVLGYEDFGDGMLVDDSSSFR